MLVMLALVVIVLLAACWLDSRLDRIALIRIDMQNDFVEPTGSLYVPGAETIVALINQLSNWGKLRLPGFLQRPLAGVLRLFNRLFRLGLWHYVVDSQDWHGPKHKSFYTQHPGVKAFELGELNGLPQVFWPEHCIQESHGAQFHKDLDRTTVDATFRKGSDDDVDSYSVYFDNGRRHSTGLTQWLRKRRVKKVYFCGVALPQFCVGSSARDALSEGFEVYIIEDACRAIPGFDYSSYMAECKRLGIKIIQSSDLTSSGGVDYPF